MSTAKKLKESASPQDPIDLQKRFDALRAEHDHLLAEVKRINDLAVHLNSGGRDPDEKCYSKRDVEALIAITRAAEKMHGSSERRGEEHG